MEGREPLSQHWELKPENRAGERHRGDTEQQFLRWWVLPWHPQGGPTAARVESGTCINPITALNNENGQFSRCILLKDRTHSPESGDITALQLIL